MRSAIFSAIAGAKIQEGILRGVAVLTIGEAKGHDVFIDQKSLETYLLAAKSRAGGVPVKMDHGTGFYHIVGKLENFRVEGDTLRADLHLLKSHEQFPRIVEMAETMAESFGLSVSSTATREEVEGKDYLRCDELNSVDLVDRPAANPTGLFSQPVDSPQKGMADKSESLIAQLKTWAGITDNADLSAAQANLKTANDRIAELSAKVSELEKLPSAHATTLASKDKEIADLKAAQGDFDKKVLDAAGKKAADLVAASGLPRPVESTPSATPANPAPAKTELKGFAKTEALIALEIGKTTK